MEIQIDMYQTCGADAWTILETENKFPGKILYSISGGRRIDLLGTDLYFI